MSLANFNECIFNDYLAGQKAHLPGLPDIQQVSPRVTRILGGNPGRFQLQGTNTYLVGSGPEKILIDTAQGEPEWIESVASCLALNGLAITHVLLTHWHWDHTGGVPDLIARYPELASSVYKNRPDSGQLSITDGQVFKVDGATLRAVYTPGHADDHMCFLLEEENALFTGDNVLGHGYTVVEDLALFSISLNTMGKQGCSIGYPAHGDVIADLPGVLERYKGQQARRERQILLVLKRSRDKQQGKGSITVREIVTAVYGEVTEELSRLALEPFANEVLLKLAKERKVGFQLRQGVKRWFLVA